MPCQGARGVLCMGGGGVCVCVCVIWGPFGVDLVRCESWGVVEMGNWRFAFAGIPFGIEVNFYPSIPTSHVSSFLKHTVSELKAHYRYMRLFIRALQATKPRERFTKNGCKRYVFRALKRN